jgi:hypothetical protein
MRRDPSGAAVNGTLDRTNADWSSRQRFSGGTEPDHMPMYPLDPACVVRPSDRSCRPSIVRVEVSGRPVSPRKVHRYSGEFKLTAVKLSGMPWVQMQTVANALDIHPVHAVALAERGTQSDQDKSATLCWVLGVSPSGSYAWRQRLALGVRSGRRDSGCAGPGHSWPRVPSGPTGSAGLRPAFSRASILPCGSEVDVSRFRSLPRGFWTIDSSAMIERKLRISIPVGRARP